MNEVRDTKQTYGEVFKKRLRYTLKQRHMTQQSLADEIGISLDTIKKASKEMACTNRVLDAIAQGLKVDPDYLTGKMNMNYQTERNRFIEDNLRLDSSVTIEQLGELFDWDTLGLTEIDVKASTTAGKVIEKPGDTFVDPDGIIAFTYQYRKGIEEASDGYSLFRKWIDAGNVEMYGAWKSSGWWITDKTNNVWNVTQMDAQSAQAEYETMIRLQGNNAEVEKDFYKHLYEICTKAITQDIGNTHKIIKKLQEADQDDSEEKTEEE